MSSGSGSMQDALNDIKKSFDQFLGKLTFLNNLEQQTNVPKLYLFLGILAPIVLILIRLVGLNFVTNLYGALYPTLASFRAIRSTDKNDDTQWLTYWTIFSVFPMTEAFLATTKTFQRWTIFWILIYYPIKLIVITWAMFPHTKGGEFIFKNVINPIMDKLEGLGGGSSSSSSTPAPAGNR